MSLKKYEKIAEELTRRIRAGIYANGSFLPRQTELCAEFQTSRSNLHKALNVLEFREIVDRRQGRRCRVTDDTPRKILFVFYSSIRNYEMRMPGLAERYRRGILRFCREYDYTVTERSGEEFQRENNAFPSGFSGVILSGQFSGSELKRVIASGLPVVALCMRLEEEIDYISFDFYHAGELAAQTVLENGYAHPLLIHLKFDSEPSFSRSHLLTGHGFSDAFPREPPVFLLEYRDLESRTGSVDALKQKLQTGGFDCAVYSVNLGYASLRDDSFLGSFPSITVDSQIPVDPRPGLTRIECDHALCGYQAGLRLHQRIYHYGSAEPVTVLLPVKNAGF